MAASPRGAIVWRAGDPQLREALAPLLHALAAGRGGGRLEILRDKPGRRRLGRAVLDAGPVCFLKLYRDGSKRTRRRRVQRPLGLTTPAREFATLRRLRAAGVAVPEPLAWARLPAGEEVVVTRYLEGQSLTRAVKRPHRERVALLYAVGRLVAQLHDAGHVHRDLHRENVWVTPDGRPLLIDLQAAWRLTTPALRRRDGGELERSLAPLLSLPDRMRLRAALLGVEPPFSASARRRLRALGAAAHARSLARVRSRTVRALQPGRLYARWRWGGGRGLRMRSADEATLRRALEGSPDEAFEVIHFPASARRWRAGRTSPARRAWVAGQGLHARGIAVRRPIAFVERGGWLRPGDGWLVLERGGAPPESGAAPPAAARVGAPVALPTPDEIRVLGLSLARFGVRHRRLDALARAERARAPDDLPLCRNRKGALALGRLHEVVLPRRRRADALDAIDAFVRIALRSAAGTPAERDAALRRYRRERRFLPGGGVFGRARRRRRAPGVAEEHVAAPADQPSARRRGSSDAASAPPQLDASRGSSSQT